MKKIYKKNDKVKFVVKEGNEGIFLDINYHVETDSGNGLVDVEGLEGYIQYSHDGIDEDGISFHEVKIEIFDNQKANDSHFDWDATGFWLIKTQLRNCGAFSESPISRGKTIILRYLEDDDENIYFRSQLFNLGDKDSDKIKPVSIVDSLEVIQ